MFVWGKIRSRSEGILVPPHMRVKSLQAPARAFEFVKIHDLKNTLLGSGRTLRTTSGYTGTLGCEKEHEFF